MQLAAPLALVALSALGRGAAALPSFGTRLPNGLEVPCPPGAEGCIQGICRGVGHPTCGGGISGAVPQPLNAFGADFRDAGFQWTPELCAADSDGDGLTNGEELGDPCCVWTVAGSVAPDGVAPYTRSFVPSHPGDGDHFVEDYVRPVCGTGDTAPPSDGDADADDDADADGLAVNGISGYNPGEVRGSFDLVMPEYAIPRKTTQYIDVVFNIPQDLPGLFHIVYGEALVSQPKHLHHFVVTGCSERVDDDRHGRPLSRVPDSCNIPVGGFAGWAPGATMWGFNKDVGTPLGEDIGIVALQVNIHYTDGDAPYLNGEKAIATDGIRIQYTPTLRPKTATSTPVINVGFGPPAMFVEPNKKRAFMTRTCTVQSRCKDTPDAEMMRIGAFLMGDATVTCSKSRALCLFSEQFKMACPITCGLCSKEDVSPRNPEEYQAVGVFYHAHLLGTEMYNTLIPYDDPTERIDLNSQSIWTYEDQPMYPISVPIRVGDKIQSTCIFDSTGRTERTQFDIETYDEMCLNTVAVVLDTPTVGEGGLSPANEIRLRGFSCENSPAADIWLGELGTEENGLLVADNHPLKSVDCSFPTAAALFDGPPNFERRCSGKDPQEEDTVGICQVSGSRLRVRQIAGATCFGGALDMKDANDGTTEEECIDGGGEWSPYTCGEIDDYVQFVAIEQFGSEVTQYLIEEWWAPKCCALLDNDADEEESEFDAQDEEESKDGLCNRTPDVASRLVPTAIAGAACEGGTLDQKDVNDGTTKEQCIGGGGEWVEYNCVEADDWLQYESDLDSAMEEYLVEEWWAPKCCIGTVGDAETASTQSSANRSANSSSALIAVGCILLVANLVSMSL